LLISIEFIGIDTNNLPRIGLQLLKPEVDNYGLGLRSAKNKSGKDDTFPIESTVQEMDPEELEPDSQVILTVTQVPIQKPQSENKLVAVENEGPGVLNQKLSIGRDM